MKKTRMVPMLILAGLLSFAALGGCGSPAQQTAPETGTNSGATSGGGNTANTETPAEPVPAAEEKMNLVHEGKLTYAMSGLLRPFNLICQKSPTSTSGGMNGFFCS